MKALRIKDYKEGLQNVSDYNIILFESSNSTGVNCKAQACLERRGST